MDNLADYEGLASRILGGNCVLVLGPGVSTISNGDQETPIHVGFARQLSSYLINCEKLNKRQERDLNADDLRHVSQLWQEIEKNAAKLQFKCAQFYQQYSGKTTEFHRNIAALPFQLCITTTPDDFLFNAMTEAGKTPVRDFYHFKKAHDFRRSEFSVKSPLIYHLYGHTQDTSSLVVTETDLIDFLTNVVRKSPPLPEKITGILGQTNSACLFVDLGFKNWYLRVLMRSLQGEIYHNEKSVALEPAEFFAESRQHQTMLYFSSGNTMEFLPQGSLNDFALQLRNAYESMAGPREEINPEPPTTAPVAFLSYASEDRDIVERLSQALKVGGVAVWLDRQNLRGGDNWLRQIYNVIEKQVNYFVPVQAAGMMRDGYFHGEIRVALDHQHDKVRDGAKFVIPVHTDGRFRLERLNELRFHSISIADLEGGAKELVATIVADWNTQKVWQEGTAMSSTRS